MTSVRTRIKVCGITNLADAKAAVAAGVDALGFIFVDESPRKIDPERAREIIGTLPPFVDTVGVFVDEEVDVVNDISRYCDLSFVQLHGSESVEYCNEIGTKVVKAVGVRAGMETSVFGEFTDSVRGFLLDTYHEKLAGGTGKTFNWDLIDGLEIPRPMILAGGISPENVGEAIRQVNPYAVDVNSGVEKEPGIKDVDLIRRFVEEVNKADLTLLQAAITLGD